MIDQQNRKAFGNFNCVAGSADHDDDREPICEYTQSSDVMTRIKGGCALSVKRICRKREKYRRKLRRPHLTKSSFAKEKARIKQKAKATGGFAAVAVSRDTLHESSQLLNGKGRASIGSRRKSGRSTILASSRSSGTAGGQETRKATGKAQTNLMEKDVCPSKDRKV